MISSRRLFLVTFLAIASAFGAHAQTANPQVKFVTSAGEFVVELAADKAPATVENFLGYVRDGHYNGTIFHRVINNFMIQGGGYDTKYQEKSTKKIILLVDPTNHFSCIIFFYCGYFCLLTHQSSSLHHHLYCG